MTPDGKTIHVAIAFKASDPDPTLPEIAFVYPELRESIPNTLASIFATFLLSHAQKNIIDPEQILSQWNGMSSTFATAVQGARTANPKYLPLNTDVLVQAIYTIEPSGMVGDRIIQKPSLKIEAFDPIQVVADAGGGITSPVNAFPSDVLSAAEVLKGRLTLAVQSGILVIEEHTGCFDSPDVLNPLKEQYGATEA